MKSALLRTPLILNKFAFLTSSISKSVMTWSFKKIRLPLWVRLSHYSELWVPVLYTFFRYGPWNWKKWHLFHRICVARVKYIQFLWCCNIKTYWFHRYFIALNKTCLYFNQNLLFFVILTDYFILLFTHEYGFSSYYVMSSRNFKVQGPKAGTSNRH